MNVPSAFEGGILWGIALSILPVVLGVLVRAAFSYRVKTKELE